MGSGKRATLVANDELAEDQPSIQRARLPDDPKLRVELAPGFRQELADEKRLSIAAAVQSPRDDSGNAAHEGTQHSAAGNVPSNPTAADLSRA